jgi:hypothetical protein
MGTVKTNSGPENVSDEQDRFGTHHLRRRKNTRKIQFKPSLLPGMMALARAVKTYAPRRNKGSSWARCKIIWRELCIESDPSPGECRGPAH